MDQEKFADLVRPLERLAVEQPRLYRFRVGMLAVLGYVYLLGVVLALLAIVVVTLFYVRLNFLVLKFVWIPLVLVALVLRSLWISLPVPDGSELKREQAPVLFDLIDEVTRALSGPTVHHVLLTDEYNASIVQIPMFGMFGWLRNYLMVGLPLLRAFNPDEFRAVLAHEVGHLSGKHGRFFGWIYRLRQSWVQILTTVHAERHYASFLFEPFLNWYAPYLNAYSFVLARAQERQADGYAVDLAGKDAVAVMLVRMETKQRELRESFWPGFFRQSKTQPTAPRDPFAQMLAGLERPVGPASTQKWFFEALRVPTDYEDTHPALADRLEAIGFAKDGPEIPRLVEALVQAEEKQQSAASYYLKDLPEDFLAMLNRLWRERINQSWRNSHEEFGKAQQRLTQIEEEAKKRSLTVEEQWERISLIDHLEDRKSTLPLLEAFLNEQPDHLGAHFAKGALLLEQQNPEGIKHLEKASEDLGFAREANSLISGFYLEQGNNELAAHHRKLAEKQFALQRKQQEQATTFSTNDRLVPHGLAPDVVQGLKDQLRKLRGLEAAYLVGKIIESSEAPVYLLAFVTGFTWKDGQADKHVGELMDQLTNISGLPSPVVFLSLDGTYSHLLNKISRVEGAELFASRETGVSYRH